MTKQKQKVWKRISDKWVFVKSGRTDGTGHFAIETENGIIYISIYN